MGGKTGSQVGTRRAERGQALIMFVLAAGVLCGFVAMAIDVGLILHERRVLQNAADAAARDAIESAEWDRIVASGSVVCGSPDQVAERIAEIHELCGITHYLAWTRIGGLEHGKVLRSMELMRDKVMPQVRHLDRRSAAKKAS